MIVVISDLHFAEEQSDFLYDGVGSRLELVRNLPARAFRRFVAAIAQEAERNDANGVDLVFAGDIFDVHRTSLWHTMVPPIRPFVSCGQVRTGSSLEARTLHILDQIAAEKDVNESLEVFRLLGGPNPKHHKDPNGAGNPVPFPKPVNTHLIPGNHDRLINATPAIRKKARGLLGLSGDDAPFPQIFLSQDPPILVRHGHEYDPANFSENYRDRRSLVPTRIPRAEYGAPTLGDFATVNIASRLPTLFLEVHGRDDVLREPQLQQLYVRLLEVDDVRPQGAIFSYLLAPPQPGVTAKSLWRHLQPVTIKLLEEIHDDPFFRDWLKKLERRWQPDAIDALQAMLELKPWKAGMPLKLVRFLAGKALKGRHGRPPEETAEREEAIRDGNVRCVIAGHTHKPKVAHISPTRDEIERYYVDVGTWRNRIPSNSSLTSFGRVKALSYVVAYASNEDLRGVQGKVWSFDYWSGYTQRWES